MDTIKVNDVVYVAKPLPCCGEACDLGTTFTVERLRSVKAYCFYCGKHWPGVSTVAEFIRHNGLDGYPLEVLKKFDPKSASNVVQEINDIIEPLLGRV